VSEYEGKYDARDYTGRKIETGDLVAYPVRRRSDMWLTSARVSEISWTVDQTFPIERGDLAPVKTVVIYKILCYNEKGNRVLLRHPARLIVIGE
jgi:hypothetical protein